MFKRTGGTIAAPWPPGPVNWLVVKGQANAVMQSGMGIAMRVAFATGRPAEQRALPRLRQEGLGLGAGAGESLWRANKHPVMPAPATPRCASGTPPTGCCRWQQLAAGGCGKSDAGVQEPYSGTNHRIFAHSRPRATADAAAARPMPMRDAPPPPRHEHRTAAAAGRAAVRMRSSEANRPTAQSQPLRRRRRRRHRPFRRCCHVCAPRP